MRLFSLIVAFLLTINLIARDKDYGVAQFHEGLDCVVEEIGKRDTSKHRFINKITIYAGLINYLGISNIEGRYNSIPGSFYLSLTTNKNNIALKLGEMSKAESTKLNPNSKDHFAAGYFSYLALSKCFRFKKINYNLGLAGTYSSIYYYPDSEVDYLGGGILFDFSINFTKLFSVNGYYINSLYSRNSLHIDNYFSFGVGFNIYRR